MEVFFKVRAVQRHRPTLKQRTLAMSAIGRAAQLCRSNAVGGVAMRADDVKGLIHAC